MCEKLQALILRAANSARSQTGEGLLRHLAGGRIDDRAVLPSFIALRDGLEKKLSAWLKSVT